MFLLVLHKQIEMNKAGNGLITGTTLILIAAGSRLLPHWHNFTAVGAVGLFGAFYYRKQIWAFLLPLISMWISDLMLNNWVYSAYHEGFVWFTSKMLYVYFGFIGLVLVGHAIIKKLNGSRIFVASILGTIVFFLVTNFGSFMQDPIYPKTAEGLILAFTAGLPFFWNTLLSNLVYSSVFFGVYYWITERDWKYKSA